MVTAKAKLTDEATPILRKADEGEGEVLIGNEQFATTWDDEDASDKEAVKGPSDTQWPATERDMRLKINKAGDSEFEDGKEGYVKGPDPTQHPDRPWADQYGKLDPDAVVVKPDIDEE